MNNVPRKYHLTVDQKTYLYGQEAVMHMEYIADTKAEYMEHVYKILGGLSGWLSEQSTYLALVNHSGPHLMVGDENTMIHARMTEGIEP